MWIVPKQLLQAFALDTGALKSESPGQCSETLSQLFTVRGKCLPSKTFLLKLNREFSTRLLSTRILHHSHTEDFEVWWISLVQAYLASHTAVQEKEKVEVMKDSCLINTSMDSQKCSQNKSSSKTSKGSSQVKCQMGDSASGMCSEDWRKSDIVLKIKMGTLRQEYLARKKLALHTEENVSSSWRTPSATEAERGSELQEDVMKKKNPIITLTHQVNWPTPIASEAEKGQTQYGSGNPSLLTAVKQDGLPVADNLNTNGKPKEQWPTPRSMIGGPSKGIRHSDLNQEAGGHLNPEWVEQLMGLPTGLTSFDSWEEELHQQQQSELLGY